MTRIAESLGDVYIYIYIYIYIVRFSKIMLCEHSRETMLFMRI